MHRCSMIRMPKKTLSLTCSLIFLAVPIAKADCWQVGTCKAKSLPYANITFLVDQCSDLTETVMWAKEKQGLLIKEKDMEEYSVIWHEGIQSPEVEYIECDRGMEQG